MPCEERCWTILRICRSGETAIAIPHVAAANAMAVTTAPPYLQSPDGQAERHEADFREPTRAARLRAPRAVRGGSGADRHGGEVAARGPRCARAGVRRRPRRRGVARRGGDLRVRPGEHREPRPGPRPEAPPPPG